MAEAFNNARALARQVTRDAKRSFAGADSWCHHLMQPQALAMAMYIQPALTPAGPSMNVKRFLQSQMSRWVAGTA